MTIIFYKERKSDMKNLKKISALILCLCMSAAIMTACGTTKPSTTTPEDPPPAPAVSEPVKEPAGAGDGDLTQGDKVNLVFATDLIDANPGQLALNDICDEISELTSGRITIEMYGNSQLGTSTEQLEQCNNGLIDMHYATGISNYCPEYGALQLPYMFMNYDHARAVFTGEIGEYFKQLVADNTNMYALQFGAIGYRNLTSNKLIQTPEDIKGMKIRTREIPADIAGFEALGAIPTPMAFSELFTALQQGTVDGHDNTVTVILNNNLDSVQNYIYLSEHTLDSGIIVMNKESLDNLSETDREFIISEFDTMLERSIAKTEASEEDVIQQIISRGDAEVIRDFDKQAFADIMHTIYVDYEDAYGKDLLDSIVNCKY